MVEKQITTIALLRGINVGGHNKIRMPELRDTCISLGWGDVQSYIQSGNLVFKAKGEPASLEAALEQAIERQFSLSIPVIVRSAADWSAYSAGNPFPEASEREPNLVMLLLSKEPPRQGAVEAVLEHARASERVERVGDALWVHYPNGSGRSTLTTTLLDRLVGSTVTARNWRTVLKIAEMVNNSGIEA